MSKPARTPVLHLWNNKLIHTAPSVVFMYLSKFGLLGSLVIIWLTALYVLPDVVSTINEMKSGRTICMEISGSPCIRPINNVAGISHSREGQ